MKKKEQPENQTPKRVSAVVRSGETPIDNIGGIVASEIHGLSSWDGYTEKMWAKFNVDPKSVPIAYLRKCLVEVRPIEEARPNGFIWIIAGINIR